MSTIEVLETTTEVVEVVEQGPQGVAGADGADGVDGLGVPAGGLLGEVLTKQSANDGDSNWERPPFKVLHTLTSNDTEEILLHDGTPATELVVPLSDVSNDKIVVSNNEVEVIGDLSGARAIIQVHLIKTGGSVTRTILWEEISFDGGTNWTSLAMSLRGAALNNDSEGVQTYELSTDPFFPVGSKLRILMSRLDSGGTVNLAPVGPVVTSNGTINGHSVVFTLMY
jgi:hypothetical protein